MSETATRPRRAQRTQDVAPTPVISPAASEVPADDTGLPERSAVRKPFGSRRQKLFYPTRPGFHRHWFHDTPGRIKDAKEAGYSHVAGDDGRNVSRVVGVREGGGDLTAYLMEIPDEWYKDDQVAKLKPREEIDAQIKRGINQDGSGYASSGMPGFTGSKITSQSEPSGRQFFGDT